MLASLAGIFFAGIFAYKTALKKGIDEVEMIILLLVSAACSLVGSHLLYGITNFNAIVALVNNPDKIDSFQTFIEHLKAIFGGAVFYGGLITGLIGGFIYLKKKKLDIETYPDIGAVSIPLFHCFGRIGCFLGGCCYGVESSFGFVYSHSLIEQANGVRRFPVQLLEASLNLILFFFLLYLLKKNRLKGRLLYLYLLIYSAMRFVIEFWRGDSYRGFILGLSTSQFIGIFLFVFALIIIFRKRKNTYAG